MNAYRSIKAPFLRAARIGAAAVALTLLSVAPASAQGSAAPASAAPASAAPASAAPRGATGLAISQIEASALLSRQRTRLYLSAPGLARGSDGLPAVEIWESPDGVSFERAELVALSERPNEDFGISFLLLLDNSGSMWTDRDGGPGEQGQKLRIEAAKEAAAAFISSLGPKDRVGLVVFNTRYWAALAPGSSPEDALRALDEIRRPSSEDAYTELYLSLERAIRDFAMEPGRRALIALSDGENYPYALIAGKPNPETGLAAASPAQAIDAAIREGVTVYALRYGAQKDQMLGAIADGSGGRSFDADDASALASVYDTIRRDVLAELAVDYRASMAPGERRWVRVAARDVQGRELRAERYYYVGTLFGSGAAAPEPFYFLAPLAAALLWLALVLFRLERETDKAGLRLLFAPGGQKTRFVPLAGVATVIGASPDADLSVAGNPALGARHATVLFDQATASYTLVADGSLTVNNRTVTKKKLESGDVINLAGTVVVFDEALAKAARAAKPDAKAAGKAGAGKPRAGSPKPSGAKSR